MSDKSTNIQSLKDKVLNFVQERDWDDFHNPKNLAMSIAIEASELMEIFQWLNEEESNNIMDSDENIHLKEELADIIIYCLSLANRLDIDVSSAIEDKIKKNAIKYPEVFKLPDSLKGRSIKEKVIPTVCNLENMLNKLLEVDGDYNKLKPWEQSSYRAYACDEIHEKILKAWPTKRKMIIREHILNKDPNDLGPNCIDIYLIAYVSENYGVGRERFIEYIYSNGISDKENSAQAIWQVGKGDGVYLDLLNEDGTIKNQDFFKKWTDETPENKAGELAKQESQSIQEEEEEIWDKIKNDKRMTSDEVKDFLIGESKE